MKRMPNWTPEEKEYLRVNMHQVPWAAIAAHLGRTVNACQLKASEMGLTGIDEQANERLDQAIRARFAEGGAAAVREEFPEVSARTIHRRANALGVRHAVDEPSEDFTHIVKPQGSWERTPVNAPTSVFDLASV